MEPVHHVEYRADGVTVWCEEWCLNGLLHREDGPAYLRYWGNGSVRYEMWYLDGRVHRRNGPARTDYRKNGMVKSEEWLRNGVLRRGDGPAYIQYRKDGSVKYKGWALNGWELSETEWRRRTQGKAEEEEDWI